MTISIGTNILSQRVLRLLGQAQGGLTASFQKLSSGQRINRASDDAAGLAVSSSLRADSRIYAQGIRNINDGTSLLNIASGALSNLSNVTTRLKELAEQAANGSFSRTQRLSLDEEAKSLVLEFNRILGSTTFNGLNLLNGLFGRLRIQGGYGEQGGIAFDLGQEITHAAGQGTFSVAQTIVGTNNSSSYVGDVDGDSIDDILYDISGDGVYLVKGNGDGTFQTSQQLLSEIFVSNTIFGDLDNDGDIDFVSFDGEDNLTYINNGSGGFTQPATVPTAFASTATVKVADINGDGFNDLIGSNGLNLRVSYGLGGGLFGSAVDYAVGGTIREIKVADFNGDGRNDVAVGSNSFVLAVSILLQNGSGSLGTATTFGGSARGIDVGDINHDGIQDIVYSAAGTISTLIGNGDGTFSSGRSFSAVGAGTTMVTLGDTDNDGLLDLIVGTNSNVTTYKGDGAGNFSQLSTKAKVITRPTLLSDINGDGVLDMILATSAAIESHLGNTQQTTSIARLDLTTQAGALSALDSLDDLLSSISLEQGQIGSMLARLETASKNLQSTVENIYMARSRITDIDAAEEVTQLTRFQILQDLGARVLAQANQVPEIALRLLQQS